MAHKLLSEAAFGFVGGCQVVMGDWLRDDAVLRFSRTWTCLSAIPPRLADSDRVAVSNAVVRLAQAFFTHIADGTHVRPHADLNGRRLHAHAVLAQLVPNYARQSVTLTGLAKVIGVSRTHLSHVLVRETGHPFATHLNGLRVLRAAILLTSLNLRIKEVAALSGYFPTSELDRQFNRRLRMTPSDFRRAHTDFQKLVTFAPGDRRAG